jgi:hypothetical protein
VVLSVIVAPRGDDPRFARLVGEIVKMALEGTASERPVTVDRLGVSTPLKAMELEATALRASGGSRFSAIAKAVFSYTLGVTFHKFKLKAGVFDAGAYAADVAANADFRKFDDGLRMTLDCSPAFADNLEAKLSGAEEFSPIGGSFDRNRRRLPVSSLRLPKGTMSISSTALKAVTRWRRKR